MLKKILSAICVLIICLCSFAYYWWTQNEARLKEEYAAFRKIGAPILMYHAVGSREGKENWPDSLILSGELFESHMKYLKEEGYTIVAVEEIAKRLSDGESVDKFIGLTFDDGYKNNSTVAIPIMKKYGAKGTFFVINQDIGKPEKMGDTEIFSLLADGMELGSHTTSHAPLAKIEPKFLAWELSTSRFYLKKNYNRYIVRSLAYPNGDYNELVIAKAKEYGFYRAVTGHIGLNTPDTFKKAPMEMYRVTVADDGNGLEGFKKRLEQAYFFGFLQTKGIDVNVVRDIFIK
ncbi:MAG: polysaccharide deacetylase family protein [Phascolarctobacterium sp.]|nr:polysaccharide deacetylase family protein [Phascolarctobacterium sp.]